MTTIAFADLPRYDDLRVAVANATLGRKVIPYRQTRAGKRPCLKGWTQRGTSVPFELDSWFSWEFPDAHPGIVTGPDTGEWVLDIDCKNGVDGFATLAGLEAQYGPLPETFTVRTPSGGEHRYFKWPADGTIIKTFSWKDDPGIDTRGLGGFVAAPGSRNGFGDYEVIKDIPVAEAPAWIVQRYHKDIRERVEVDPRARTDPGCIGLAREALTRRENDLASAREPGRNNALNRAAFMLGQFGAHGLISESEARSALVNGACAVNGLLFEDGSDACHRTFDSGWNAGLEEPAVLFDGGATVVSVRERLLDAGTWALDEPEKIPAAWGRDEDVLWPEGEPTTIAGGQGAGKTTISQRLVLCRIGVDGDEPTLLGYPVARDDRPVLYLAMDRPRQAARSLRRMFGEEHRALIDARLKVWRGPLPFNVIERPERLAEWALDLVPDLGLVVTDSVKDIAPGISKDEVGSAINQAYQYVVTAGVELLAPHHQRKAENGKRRGIALDDIYGSTWLTAGNGSVLLIDGDAGDEVVTLHQVKPAAEVVGPLRIRHDHARGDVMVLAQAPSESHELVVAVAMVRAVRDLQEKTGSPPSQRAILAYAKVKAGEERKRAALEHVSSPNVGALRQVDGPRNAILYEWVHDLGFAPDRDTATDRDSTATVAVTESVDDRDTATPPLKGEAASRSRSAVPTVFVNGAERAI